MWRFFAVYSERHCEAAARLKQSRDLSGGTILDCFVGLWPPRNDEIDYFVDVNLIAGFLSCASLRCQAFRAKKTGSPS